MSKKIKHSRFEEELIQLRQDPPCLSCEQPRSQHLRNKCLFGPQPFKAPGELALWRFRRWGTFNTAQGRPSKRRPYG